MGGAGRAGNRGLETADPGGDDEVESVVLGGHDDVESIGPEGQEVEAEAPCLLYTSPSPRDKRQSRMPSSA